MIVQSGLIRLGLLLLLWVAGCGEERPPIAPERMRPILLELQLAEARLAIEHPDNRWKRDSLGRKYWGQILAGHGLKSDQFREALDWYTQHPKAFLAVQDSVLLDLNLRLAQLPPDLRMPQIPMPQPNGPLNPMMPGKSRP